ncbi:ParA family protein [Cetobacterium sp. 2A]|uniref:ParA family protein n=1 Tax=unclassified Cetobacterium TaxID=2630983 RepID=UPI00163B7816|nr:ParA family protein [Cetobacterium sp. 2A]MBC2855530.1 ParA family protein [Cetobacterium sp. 2A]
MRKLVIINQKGGEAKTTTSRNISEILALKGLKTLVIDMDPQGNLTTNFDINKREVKTLFDVFNREVDINDVIIEKTENLSIIPNNIKMAKANMQFAGHPNWARLLRKSLKELDKKYDYIIMDCPPALDFSTYNALNAATEIIVTLQAEENSLEGISDLMDTIEEVRDDNEALKICGVVITRFKSNTNLHKGFKGVLDNYFGEAMFKTVIRDNIKVAEANQSHKSVLEYDKESNGAKDYSLLVEEIIIRN